MDQKTKQLAGRLALCGGTAAVALRAAEGLPALAPYQSWLREHRLEAGAALAAALLGLSLAFFPLSGPDEPDSPADPCSGYSPVS